MIQTLHMNLNLVFIFPLGFKHHVEPQKLISKKIRKHPPARPLCIIMCVTIIMCRFKSLSLSFSTSLSPSHSHSKWLQITNIVAMTIPITITTSITFTTFDRDFECLPRPCKPSPCGCGGCTGRNIRLIINIPISTFSSNC